MTFSEEIVSGYKDQRAQTHEFFMLFNVKNLREKIKFTYR